MMDSVKIGRREHSWLERASSDVPDGRRRQLYREQLWCVESEVRDLLRRHRAGVVGATCACQEEVLTALFEVPPGEAEGVGALALRLRRLLEERRTVADALDERAV
jgi:O6-methylguanine-DNA--protein-cysteine methyltransferase